MKRVSPSTLLVLAVLCSAGIRNCVAVRFESLEELLRYYEQQQNPESDDRRDETKDEFISVTTTTSSPVSSSNLRPDFNHRVHHHHHHNHQAAEQNEDGSGQETFLGSEEPTTTETVPTTTTPALETEAPTTTRRMTTCCHLGELAGRRRDHCNPANYMPSVHRNRNRDHNFRKTNRPSQARNQRDKCVSGVILRLAQEFQTCCEEAYKRMMQQENGEEYNQNDRTHILEIPFF